MVVFDRITFIVPTRIPSYRFDEEYSIQELIYYDPHQFSNTKFERLTCTTTTAIIIMIIINIENVLGSAEEKYL